LKGHNHWIAALAFNPDGTRLASAGWDNVVRIWDPGSVQEVGSLPGSHDFYGVAFSPDGTRLAGASEDHTVKVWDGRPLTRDVRAEREALGLLDFLFTRPLGKADVLAAVADSPFLSPPARQKALALAEDYPEATDPDRFHRAAWALVRQPFLNAFQYRLALR